MDIRISDNEANALAVNAQEGNEAAFHVLLMKADKLAKYHIYTLSRSFGISMDSVQYDPTGTLEFCLARHDRRGAFKTYLFISIYWRVLNACKKVARNGKLVDKGEKEPRVKGEIRESDVAYSEFMANGGHDAIDISFLPWSLGGVPDEDFRIFAALVMREMNLKQAVFVFHRTPENIMYLLHNIWQRIRLNEDLKGVFEDLGFDVGALAGGRIPDLGREPLIITPDKGRLVAPGVLSGEAVKPKKGERGAILRTFEILEGNGWMDVDEIADGLGTHSTGLAEKYLEILLELGLVEVRVPGKGMLYRGVDLDGEELEITGFILSGLGSNPSRKMREEALAVLHERVFNGGSDDSPAIALEMREGRWEQFALKKWHHDAINAAIDAFRQKAYRVPEKDTVVQDFRHMLLGISRRKGYSIDYSKQVYVYSMPERLLYDEIYKNIDAVRHLHPEDERFPERGEFVLISHPGTGRKGRPGPPSSYNLFVPDHIFMLLKSAKGKNPAYMDWLRHEASHVIERAMNSGRDEAAITDEYFTKTIVTYYNLCRSGEYRVEKPEQREPEPVKTPIARIEPVKPMAADTQKWAENGKGPAIHGLQRAAVIRLIIGVREDFRDNADPFRMAWELQNRLELKGIRSHLEHRDTQFWVVTPKFVMDPFPEAGGERYIKHASRVEEDLFVIAERGSDFQMRLYTGMTYESPSERMLDSMVQAAKRLANCIEQLERKKVSLREELRARGVGEEQIESGVADNAVVRHLESKQRQLEEELEKGSASARDSREKEIGEKGTMAADVDAGVLEKRRQMLAEASRDRLRELSEKSATKGGDIEKVWTYAGFRKDHEKIDAALTPAEKRALAEIREKYGEFDLAVEIRLMLLLRDFAMRMPVEERQGLLGLLQGKGGTDMPALQVVSVLNACKLFQGIQAHGACRYVAEALELGADYESVAAIHSVNGKAEYARQYIKRTLEAYGKRPSLVETAHRKEVSTRADKKKAMKIGEEFLRSFVAMVLEEKIKRGRMGPAAKNTSDKIVIGVDTSWIPRIQKGSVQVLLDELKRSLKNAGMENVVIVREEEEDLADAVMGVIRDEKRKNGKDIAMSNVIIAADQRLLRSGAFSGLSGAFFAGIAKPHDFTDTSYTRLMEILTMAVQLAFEGAISNADPLVDYIQEGPRRYIFVPQAVPMDIGELKKMYENILKVIADA